MNNPVATYRLQFHSAFTLTEFEQIIAYLQKLGVSTIYASPVFEAVPGSTHGYDSVNPHRINPEIGTMQQLRNISARLKQNNIGWLQDIVPNHMGYHQNNPWLMDVLEKGRLSLYTPFFDAAWSSALFNDEPLMVPFLGCSLGDAIAGDELTLALEEQGLVFKYFDNYYPLNAAGYAGVLQAATSQPAALAPLLKKLLALQKITEPRSLAIDWVIWKQRLVKALKTDENKAYLDECLSHINNNKTVLRQIADMQHYRLCSWQETDRQINYRRFFTVNSLICLNIQDRAVFDHFHEQIKTLVADGIFTGLRIDHIDGLYDPDQYLERLRQLAGNDTYIVAEKILEQGEELPPHWPLQGTTGYDFLAMVNNLLTNTAAKKKLRRFYDELVPGQLPVEQQIWQKKADILFNHMGGELDNLYGLLKKLRLTDKKILAGITPEVLKKAIGQVLIHCPVYRYYGSQLPLPQQVYEALKEVFAQAKANSGGLKAALNLLEVILLEKPKLENADYNRRALQFYQRLMQFSGPLMAKGVEDTLMYTYNCFITHNEVGDAPDAFGLSVKAFHKLMQQRQQLWPLAINGTSTHDTKRGEDVRARLNVLSDMPKAWIKAVRKWQQLNAGLKQDQAPDANDEYFIYQTLLGAHPLPGQPDDDFATRLQEYLTKALREAKVHSDWAQPDDTYEQATTSFAAALLNEQSDFYASFKTFLQRTADFGILNSLAQVLLKFTCPGVPDVYQGCELWDLSLVDPDNRRPVDYALRTEYLDGLEQQQAEPQLLTVLWNERNNARIKQWLTHKLFTERRQMPDVFAKGDYIALPVKGAYKDYIMAFARRYQHTWYITVTALHLAELCREQDQDLAALKWKNTRIIIPPEAPAEWQNLLSGTSGQTGEDGIRVKEVFGTLPMALLKLEHAPGNRGAGVLMHISSLPSAYGIGDLGPGAHAFADFLGRAGQQYWQLLPLNPVTAREGFSPYSTASSMAGNSLFISPELLAADGLLTASQLAKHELPAKDKVNYPAAQKNKDKLLNLAYEAYNAQHQPAMQQAFADFCNRESHWLNDYVLYAAIKQHHDSQPWFEWLHEYRDRKNPAVKRFANQHVAEMHYLKWLQFIFYKQWHRLKDHCQTQNIKLFGDVPFYVSHDSADVWAHPEYFCLDADGRMTGVAGVPPDYFNSNGQLWGMPIFRWDKLKARGYDWWISRLRKNIELFDLVRLDHFRAFSSYWEVPATESTAKNGKWKPGPANHFFETVRQALGSLPFVAEDLGDIDQPVYQLRDDFNLPGMKILQFAFGDNLSESAYIPHNYQENGVAYTGTHDNNTTVGWFNQDAGKDVQQRIEQYTGQPVKAKNIHQVLGRIAYASTARMVILPMQDLLGLGANARMNNPSSAHGNWQWRLKPDELDNNIEKQLLSWVKLYKRI